MTTDNSDFHMQFRVLPDLLGSSAEKYASEKSFSEWDDRTKSWKTYTWKEFRELVDLWRRAYWAAGARRGDRIAILLPNSINAALCDMSVLSNALTPVPLHAVDTPLSSAFIINNSESRILVVPKALRWNAIVSTGETFEHLKEVVVADDDLTNTENSPVPVIGLTDWLKRGETVETPSDYPTEEDLAAIVYTSGTTGKPKGVMLTHRNVMTNVKDCDSVLNIVHSDVFLSYLPFSHTFERTVGYYLPTMKGANVVFSRSVLQLAEDLKEIRPTVFISVPRIFERFQAKIEDGFIRRGDAAKQMVDYAVEAGWRKFCEENQVNDPEAANTSFVPNAIDRKILIDNVIRPIHDIFGGRLRVSVVGGAAFSAKLGRFFCGLGLPVLQGYGLTESAPVIAVNKVGFNNPITVGLPLPSMQVRIGENDELQVKGDNVMKGYWKRPDATAEAFTEDGWLRTGDQADMSDAGRIRIKGRIKEIIVTSTGEKIAPADLELAIQADVLFDQVMVIGENRPFITCVAVVNHDEWERFAAEHGIDPYDDEAMLRRDIRMAALKRIKRKTANFPQYGVPRNVMLVREGWTVENGCLTVTMKLRRRIVAERLKVVIESLYTTPQAG